jgi:isocitrate dehydrogenase kinase/phosphatase
MFSGNGLHLYKLVCGRGRTKEEVIVKYDKSYPAYRISRDLEALRICFDDLETYHSYISEHLAQHLPNPDDATSKLKAITDSVFRFKSESTGTRNWTKADELMAELQTILNQGEHND